MKTNKRNFYVAFFGLRALLVALFFVATISYSTFAQPGGAGDGGGNSSSGCPSDYSTCYGAAWVYETTNSNRVPIRSLYESANGPFDVYAEGCRSSGGFFKYVLVNKENASQYRSWQIGPANGNRANRSMFFGGQTNYTIYSQRSDKLPENLKNGQKYSWYAVEKAFNEAKRLGQASGYAWNGTSRLGWFCYTNEWSVSVSNSRTHDAAERIPGGTLKYDYTVKQNGWGVTNKTVQYRTVLKRMPPSFKEGTEPTIAQVQSNGEVIKGNPADGNRKINPGWEPNKIEVKNSRDLTYKVGSGDADRWICAYTYAYPKNNSSGNGDRVHDKVCDYIKGSWSLSRETRSAIDPRNPNTPDFGSTYTTGLKRTDVGKRAFFLSKIAKEADSDVDVVFDAKRQRIIKFADNRFISDCSAIRSGYTWDGNVNACVWQGKVHSLKWSKNVTENYYFDKEDERSFFGSGSIPPRIGGMRICERIATNPGDSTDSGWKYGAWSCIDVNYAPYELTPEIQTNPSVAEQGVLVDVNGVVSNSGAIVSRNTEWQIRRFEVRSSSTTIPDSITNNSAVPAAYFRGSQLIESGENEFPQNSTEVWSGRETIPDLPVGGRVCYTLSLRPYTNTSSNWSHSVSCIVIAKKPKIQVLGGDVVVGKGGVSKIATSTVRKTIGSEMLTFGSWGEYAVTASGPVYGMASGAGYSGGNASERFCAVSYLTITNAGSEQCSRSTPRGLYQYGSTLPSIGDHFNGGVNRGRNPTINVADPANKGILTATGSNVTVTASGDMQPGQWVVINARDANITIDSNIRYSGQRINSISSIPQLIIIGNNILIDGSVERIDGWLIASGASGRINTCREITKANELNANVCGTVLTVNGPVAARQLLLYRTGGSGAGEESGDPAEIFNFRADAYLWANNFSRTNSRLQTTSLIELPPRF